MVKRCRAPLSVCCLSFDSHRVSADDDDEDDVDVSAADAPDNPRPGRHLVSAGTENSSVLCAPWFGDASEVKVAHGGRERSSWAVSGARRDVSCSPALRATFESQML